MTFRRVGVFAIVLAFLAVACSGWTAQSHAQAAGPPLTPLSPSAVPSTTSTDVIVSWVPANGPAATTFTVVAFSTTGSIVNNATCGATCTSVDVPGLPAGNQYVFIIWPTNSAGSGGGAVTSWVTINSGCSAGTSFCITADATSTSAPVAHVADGYLHSTYVTPAALAPLAPTSWRVAITQLSNGTWDYSAYDTARAAGATTVTVVISEAWWWATNGGCNSLTPSCGAFPPWDFLSGYSAWVTAYVKLIEASGRHPDYWDIQNEPDADSGPGTYFTTANAATVTPANQMAMFAAAYHAIKLADSTAKVMGPSLSVLHTAPDPVVLDMTTFLDASVADGLVWDAISWHENGNYKAPADWGWLPDETIPNDVATATALIAARPALGNPKLVINEYGNQYGEVVPGWFLGQIVALENSGVAFAERTCFPTSTDPTNVTGCTGNPSNLDELILSNGHPTADYQVMAAYAALTGSRIATHVSDVTWNALGAIDSSKTVRLLIGRVASCTAAVNSDCNLPASYTPPPTSAPLTVTLPWTGTAKVLVQRIPNMRGAVDSPATVQQGTVALTGSQLTLTLPSVADGDVLWVTASPS